MFIYTADGKGKTRAETADVRAGIWRRQIDRKPNHR